MSTDGLEQSNTQQPAHDSPAASGPIRFTFTRKATPQVPMIKLMVQDENFFGEAIIPVTQIAGLYKHNENVTAIRLVNGGQSLIEQPLEEAFNTIYKIRVEDGLYNLTSLHYASRINPGDRTIDKNFYLGLIEGQHWVCEEQPGICENFNDASRRAAMLADKQNKPWQLPPPDIVREMIKLKKEIGLENFWFWTNQEKDDNALQVAESRPNGQNYGKNDLSVRSRIVYASKLAPLPLIPHL